MPPVTLAPLAIVLTRLRTDPLDRWRSDPEPRMIREFTCTVSICGSLLFTNHLYSSWKT